jgi:hypothetical protein
MYFTYVFTYICIEDVKIINQRVYLYLHVYICSDGQGTVVATGVYICTCVCMYVLVYVRFVIHIMSSYISIYICIFIYIYIYIYIYVNMKNLSRDKQVNLYVYMELCIDISISLWGHHTLRAASMLL